MASFDSPPRGAIEAHSGPLLGPCWDAGASKENSISGAIRIESFRIQNTSPLMPGYQA